MPWPVSTGRSLTQCSQPVLLSVRPSVRSFCDYDISKTDELIVLQIGTGTPRGNEIKWWTFVARDHRINPWKGPSLCFFLFWNLCRLKEMMSSAWIVCSLRLFHLLTTRSEMKCFLDRFCTCFSWFLLNDLLFYYCCLVGNSNISRYNRHFQKTTR